MKQVYFLGPKGTFTEIATNNFLEMGKYKLSKLELVPCSSIAKVINKVDTLPDSIGIVPLENSIDGSVRETLDNLVQASSKVMITSEIVIKISHCLIGKANKLDNITTIISHPQALAQCQNFISRNCGQDVKTITSTSTSEAVKTIINKDKSFAAIATKISAELYNLPVIAEGINDIPENYTKFVLLNENIPQPTGNDLTTIALVVRNKPGALVEILTPFADNNINLCRIESRPSKKNLGDYVFFIDFKGHIEDSKVKETIGKIAPNVDSYKFLGSYPRYDIY